MPSQECPEAKQAIIGLQGFMRPVLERRNYDLGFPDDPFRRATLGDAPMEKTQLKFVNWSNRQPIAAICAKCKWTHHDDRERVIRIPLYQVRQASIW